jgi:gluconokinase
LTSRGEEAVTYVYLKGSRDMIAERMRRRTGHYMPEKLLDSQFETLEEPKDAVVVDIEQPPESICRQVLAELEARRA